MVQIWLNLTKMTEPVLHVLVVGFHHKKGCVVEYSTPPLIAGQDCRSGEVGIFT